MLLSHPQLLAVISTRSFALKCISRAIWYLFQPQHNESACDCLET
jgi:hypothetical protein